MSGSCQSVCAANFRLGETLLEESRSTGQRMLAAENGSDMLLAISAGAMPTSEKIRAYRQHIFVLGAESQADLARVNREHGQEASDAVHASADEATRVAEESYNRHIKQNDDMLKNFHDLFQKGSNAGPKNSHASADTGMDPERRVKPERRAGNGSSHRAL